MNGNGIHDFESLLFFNPLPNKLVILLVCSASLLKIAETGEIAPNKQFLLLFSSIYFTLLENFPTVSSNLKIFACKLS